MSETEHLMETQIPISDEVVDEFGHAFKFVLDNDGEIKGVQSKQVTDPAKSWVLTVEVASIPNAARVFFTCLDAMSHEFRKAKYALVFTRLYEPATFLLEMLLRGTAPSDVEIATVSGSMKTLLKQLGSLKRGSDRVAKFQTQLLEVQESLGFLISSIQQGLRELNDSASQEELKKFKKLAASAYALGKSNSTQGARQVSRIRRAVFETKQAWPDAVASIRTQIDFLLMEPEPPTCMQTIIHAFRFQTALMGIGLFLTAMACGIFTCSSWYNGVGENVNDFHNYMAPVISFAVGCIFMAVAYRLSASHLASDWKEWKQDVLRHLANQAADRSQV